MTALFRFDEDVVSRIQAVKKVGNSLSNRFKTVMYVTPDNPNFTLEAYGVTATYSMTQSGVNMIHRHLSVCASEDGKLAMPNMVLVFTLGYYFGFTGVRLDDKGIVDTASSDWIIRHFPDECTSLLSQRIALVN